MTKRARRRPKRRIGFAPERYRWDGRELTAAEWAREPEARAAGLSGSLIWDRINRGWSVEEAVTVPPGGRPRPRMPAPTCVDCGAEISRASKRCVPCFAAHARTASRALPTHPGALIDGTTRYADDPRAQYVVAAHPDGLTLDEIGELLGLTRERVRQIEEQALASLRRRLELAGVTAEDFARFLAERDRRAV